tara:strand:+ start:2076 stop:2270 length:195 start_codon:yes stop_codon:yes gene_type:complete
MGKSVCAQGFLKKDPFSRVVFFETAFMELAPLENEGGQSFGGKTVEISDGKARPFNERNSLSHK